MKLTVECTKKHIEAVGNVTEWTVEFTSKETDLIRLRVDAERYETFKLHHLYVIEIREAFSPMLKVV